VAGEKELEGAKAELAGLVGKAAQEAKEATAKAPPGEAQPVSPLPELEGLGDTMEKAKRKIDIAGSFQAAAIAGMGAGKSVEDEQLTEQKKHTSELEKLNKKADKMRQVNFA
jgi:hypothetical protein